MEKFLSLVPPRKQQCYNTLLRDFRSMIYQVVAYGRVNTKRNFKHLALNVVAVAYERF